MHFTSPYQAFYRQLLLLFGQIPNIQKRSKTKYVSNGVSRSEFHFHRYPLQAIDFLILVHCINSVHQQLLIRSTFLWLIHIKIFINFRLGSYFYFDTKILFKIRYS